MNCKQCGGKAELVGRLCGGNAHEGDPHKDMSQTLADDRITGLVQ
jgi:hypothetical protein